MKKLTSILIAAVLFTAVTANPTGQMTYFATHEDTLYVLREGADNPIASFDLPSGTEGLTFDGEHWWMIKQPEETIYCFDYGGDYVTDFPAPAPNPYALAWDGEYLWISCDTWRGFAEVYQTTTEGLQGPYASFEADGILGLTVFQDDVVTYYNPGIMVANFYTKDGFLIKQLELKPKFDSYYAVAFSITNDGEYLWASFESEMSDWPVVENFDPYTGEGQGHYLGYTEYTGLSAGIWSYTGIEAYSFGKIKAFFDGEGRENND